MKRDPTGSSADTLVPPRRSFEQNPGSRGRCAPCGSCAGRFFWSSPSSGLPNLEESFGYGIYRETPSDEELLKRLTALPISFQPGEKWHYSNTNYWLLALLIEKLSSMSYAEFMQKNIFAPLGMASTRSALPSKLLVGRSSGYRRVGAALENRDAIQPQTGRGLGDIVSTAADMARWEREQLAPRLVSPATAALARRPVMLEDGKQEPYGYGWSTEKILPAYSVQHDDWSAANRRTTASASPTAPSIRS